MLKLNCSHLPLCLFLLGCSVKSGNDIDFLFQEIMDVHDEVMPKMGKIRDLEKQCRSIALTSPDSSELIRQAEFLSNANEAMMIWMREFNSNLQGSDSEKREYLLAQKMKIDHVEDLMNSSLLRGEKLVRSAIN